MANLALPVVVGLVLWAGGTLSAEGPWSPEGYMDHEGLTKRIRELAAGDARCSLRTVGTSTQQRELYLLTLSDDPTSAHLRPALLITAGADGRHLVGTELAVRIAERLLAEHAETLKAMTVYVLPRINPDAAETNFGDVRTGHIGAFRPVDDDHDGAVDEDGPVDLNGDGLITRMRRSNPPLDDEATHVADPLAPRLLKTPDPAKGEQAIYAVYTEGLDQDGDGLVAEDGPGAVDLDRNFPHHWPEYAHDAGPHQLSEPESAAVAQFLVAHKNIAMGLTLGRHDDLVNVPDGKGKDITGVGPRNIDADDVAVHKAIAKVYAELTGQKRAPKEDRAGSLTAWLYAQRGIPSFAAVGWGRPDPSAAEEEAGEQAPEDTGEEAGEAPGGDEQTVPETPDEQEEEAGEPPAADPVSGSWDGTVEMPDFGPLAFTLTLELGGDDDVQGTLTTSGPFPAITVSGSYDPASGQLALVGSVGGGELQLALTVDDDSMTGTVTDPEGGAIDLAATRSVADEAAGPEVRDRDAKPADPEAAAWLEYSDRDRDGAGFVEWTPFDHPTLGPVEIGGFVPGFRLNPPLDELDELAGTHTAFLVELMGRRPRLRVEGPTVRKLASGLYDVRVGLVNDGALPTATAMARKARSILPTVIRLSTPVEQVVSGEPVSRVWGLDGSGARVVHHWIVRADAGSTLKIEITNQQLGDQVVEQKLE